MLSLIPTCCGLDVHKDIIQACIMKGEAQEENPEIIRGEFGATKGELLKLAKFLVQHKCFHVAMESTGVYWHPIYRLLEEECCMEEVYVVNAHHMRNLPGRKSDVKDAEWIATLYRHGLLTQSFIPERRIRGLREISRLKRSLTNEHTSYANRLEKFLQTRGFKLSSVVSNILGASSRRMLDILVRKGTLNRIDIENARVGQLRAKPEELASAMNGELDLLECELLKKYLKKLDDIDSEIAELIVMMKRICAPDQKQIEQLDSIPGIDISAALEIIAEISPEPQRYFSNSKKLCSWAGLAPRNDESAGKIKCAKIMPGNPRIKALLCQTAWVAVYARNSTFHTWFWKRQSRIGRKKAIIAVARKMLSLIYKLLASGGFYDPNMASCA
jgi:transposase